MLLGPLLSAYATSYELMVAGRFLSGVAIGLSSTVVPTYISEVRPWGGRPAAHQVAPPLLLGLVLHCEADCTQPRASEAPVGDVLSVRITVPSGQRTSAGARLIPCVLARRLRGAQVAPTHQRGVLGTLNQLVICVGILAVLLVNVALPPTQWRTFFLLALAPGTLLLLGARATAPLSLPARPPRLLDFAPWHLRSAQEPAQHRARRNQTNSALVVVRLVWRACRHAGVAREPPVAAVGGRLRLGAGHRAAPVGPLRRPRAGGHHQPR